MNKTIFALLLLSVSQTTFADACDEKISLENDQNRTADQEKRLQSLIVECNRQKTTLNSGVSSGADCKNILETYKNNKNPADSTIPQSVSQCTHLLGINVEVNGDTNLEQGTKKDVKQSADGKIVCVKPFSYTYDYDACLFALKSYTYVATSEQFLNLQQTIRTDVKNANIQKDSQVQAASGDAQGAMFNAAEASSNHQKNMEGEKAAAYSMAVAALGTALQKMPDEDDALEVCKIKGAGHINNKDKALLSSYDPRQCEATLKKHGKYIIANGDARAALFQAITEFTAKGLAAGIKMQQYGKNAQMIAEAKKPLQEEGEDVMIELCQANPADPACVQKGNRVSGSGTFAAGDFSLGNSGNNAFSMNPDGTPFGEAGAATNIDDKNNVASVNSPFKDEAKAAKDILNPAGAAQTQATGGSGGGGGGGGGLGGGGASLGSDLNGADKDGNKEADIKTSKVSGTYSAAGGGGYRGIAQTKEDKNPFASLFDQKGQNGGVEEDNSISSGDIDGKASGLFDKISKRYGQVQADKRVEAKNLE